MWTTTFCVRVWQNIPKSAKEVPGFILHVCIEVIIGFEVTGTSNPLQVNQASF